MTEVFGVPVAVILGQLMLGLVNGSFYALLSLGLAVIFGLLGVVNFAHGAFYALGAFAALLGLQRLGRQLLGGAGARAAGGRAARDPRRAAAAAPPVRGSSPLYGLLLTFGLALVIEGSLRSGLRRLGPVLPGAPGAAGGASTWAS